MCFVAVSSVAAGNHGDLADVDADNAGAGVVHRPTAGLLCSHAAPPVPPAGHPPHHHGLQTSTGRCLDTIISQTSFLM